MEDSKFSSITFFYPSTIVGGAEFLFMRLAIYLSEKRSVTVNYVDYADGFVAKEIRANNLKINCIPVQTGRITLAKNTVVIAPLSSSMDVLSYFKGDCNLFFWSLQPMGLKNALTPFRKLRFKTFSWEDIGQDLDLMIARKALVFMDGPNLQLQQEVFKFKQTPDQFLPIVCLEKKAYLKKSIPSDVIHLGSLGRLSEEKVYSVINVIEHCKQFLTAHPNDRIKLHIIGEGESKHLVNDLVKHPNLELTFVGTLVGEDLNAYIVDNIQLMFAMGTSALEAASLKIPTVLVDLTYSPIPLDNKFRWLYESVDFSVGDLYDQKTSYAHSFQELITKIKEQTIIEEGVKCYNYFINNHSVAVIAQKLLVELEQSTLTLQNIKSTHLGKFGIIAALKKVNKLRKLHRSKS